MCSLKAGGVLAERENEMNANDIINAVRCTIRESDALGAEKVELIVTGMDTWLASNVMELDLEIAYSVENHIDALRGVLVEMTEVAA
jgi:hypothetical protein